MYFIAPTIAAAPSTSRQIDSVLNMLLKETLIIARPETMQRTMNIPMSFLMSPTVISPLPRAYLGPCLSAESVPFKVSPSSLDRFERICRHTVVRKISAAVHGLTSALSAASVTPRITPDKDSGSVLSLIDFMLAFSVIFNNYLILYNKGTHILENIHNFTFIAEKRLAFAVPLRGRKG